MQSSNENDSSNILLPPGVPEYARQLLLHVGYFELDVLKVGDIAPPIDLEAIHGGTCVRVGGAGPKPVLLIFGSYT